MTEQKKVAPDTATAVHANVHVALTAAQSQMGKLLKGELNPHFKSHYASLADVVAACRDPFAQNGLCFYHETVRDEDGRMMRTVLAHGESATEIHCDVPLIVQKNDMQAFKSATTYAKRIGLESVSGLAPEDDDGNDATKGAPKQEKEPRQPKLDPKPERKPEETRDMMLGRIKGRETADAVDALLKAPNFSAAFNSLPPPMQAEILKAATDRKAELYEPPVPTDIDDEIPL